MRAETIIHFGKIVNGQKVYYHPKLLGAVLQSLEGKEFQEIISKKEEKPSKDQHGYYRGAIIKECTMHPDFAGWERDEIDDYFCDMFLSYKKEKTLKGKSVIVTVKESTGDITKDEMTAFIDKVVRYLAMNHNLVIKESKDYYNGKYRSRTV